MDKKIVIVNRAEERVAMQDTEHHETHTGEVSKNVDAEKRELRFVFRAINFPSVESKGEIVSESFVSVKASSIEENSSRRFSCPNTTWNIQQPALEGLHRDGNKRDEQKSEVYAKEHPRSKKRVQFNEAVHVFSEPQN